MRYYEKASSTDTNLYSWLLVCAQVAEVKAYAKVLPYAVVNPAIDKRAFKAGFDEIRTRGYDRIIEEVNEQYQANK